MKLRELIKSDLARLTPDPSITTFFKWYLFPRGSTFPHDVWFRIMQKCKTSKIWKYTIGIPAYFIERHFCYKYDIHANTNVPVGKGLHIVHGSGVFLNCERIGNNFTVYQGVTLGLGKRNADGERTIPVVEDDVTVYTGAVVAGGVTLHKGCVVAANSFVNKDVPAYTMVAGTPARVIKDLHIDAT